MDALAPLLEQALKARTSVSEEATRLFNGFSEGDPEWVVERFRNALVVYDFRQDASEAIYPELVEFYRSRIPALNVAIAKKRKSDVAEDRFGKVIFGSEGLLPSEIVENGVKYSLKLTLNHDASFYVDTRLLRQDLKTSSKGKYVLNTFAYTGSLGVAAASGGATRVVQLDRSARFLDIARASLVANKLPVKKSDFQATDFFRATGRLRKEGTLFDTVIVDAPFFSKGGAGVVDLNNSIESLVAKVQPLVAHGGRLILLNNALYVSGKKFLEEVEKLTANGYMKLEKRFDVPEDALGTASKCAWPTDPAPFRHPTKIVELSVRRKDERPAG